MKINGKEIKLENETVLSGILEDQGFNLLKIAVMNSTKGMALKALDIGQS